MESLLAGGDLLLQPEPGNDRYWDALTHELEIARYQLRLTMPNTLIERRKELAWETARDAIKWRQEDSAC